MPEMKQAERDERAEDIASVLKGTSLTKPFQPKRFRADGKDVRGSWASIQDGRTIETLWCRCETDLFAIMTASALNATQERLSKESQE